MSVDNAETIKVYSLENKTKLKEHKLSIKNKVSHIETQNNLFALRCIDGAVIIGKITVG